MYPAYYFWCIIRSDH